VKIVISFALGMLGMWVISSSAVDRANDYAARVQEQYRDCRVIGQFPTDADMLAQETGQ
jgi:hypothetical protein